MAWALSLQNDDTTINLNDGTSYTALSPFNAPVPPRRTSLGGRNMSRHGSDVTNRVYNNRTVTVTVLISGTSQDNLIANINAIHSLLERASEYAISGLGSQVILRRKWENATNQVDFHVLDGLLTIGDEFAVTHRVNTKAVGVLNLLCEPFAYGAEETIQNFVLDAGFELAGTALADWTESKTATGTTARDTSVKKDGLASLKLTMTDSGGSGQVIERNQVLADVDAAEVWSFQCWVRVDALSNAKVVMELDYNTGTDVEVSTTTVNASSFVKLTANNNTVPGSVTQVTLRLRLEATAADATGTVYIDNVIAVLASAVPTAWASSHTLGNHSEDSSQAQTNYIDLQDIPGDVPALLQVRVLENDSHDEFWAGARHASRQHDALSVLTFDGVDGTAAATNTAANFTATAGDTNLSDADAVGNTQRVSKYLESGGSSRSMTNAVLFKHTWTIASPPHGTYRVLLAGKARNGAGSSSTTTWNADKFKFGLNYTYGGYSLLDTTSPDTTSFVGLTSASLAEGVYAADEILDLGTLTIPPVATPDNQTEASLDLIIHEYHTDTTTIQAAQELYWLIDWVALMPIDYGSIYVSKTDAANVLLIDSMSKVKGLYIMNASDVVQSFPTNQLGRAPQAHPNGTRIFMVGQDSAYDGTETYTVSITYRPRFLYVMGA